MWCIWWAAAAWADPVVVASSDLYPGMPILAEDVTVIDVPAGRAGLPADALSSLDAAVGRLVRQRILSGEAVRAGRLQDPAAAEPWQSTPAGSRAFPVRWDGAAPTRGEEVALVAQNGECRVGVAPVLGVAATSRAAVIDLVVALPAAEWVRVEAERGAGLKAVPVAGAPEAACR